MKSWFITVPLNLLAALLVPVCAVGTLIWIHGYSHLDHAGWNRTHGSIEIFSSRGDFLFYRESFPDPIRTDDSFLMSYSEPLNLDEHLTTNLLGNPHIRGPWAGVMTAAEQSRGRKYEGVIVPCWMAILLGSAIIAWRWVGWRRWRKRVMAQRMKEIEAMQNAVPA